MYCLDTLSLVGNPVCNQHPEVARIEGDESALQAALSQYFGASGQRAQSAIPSMGGETGGSFKMSSTAQGSSTFGGRDFGASSGQGLTGGSSANILGSTATYNTVGASGQQQTSSSMQLYSNTMPTQQSSQAALRPKPTGT